MNKTVLIYALVFLLSMLISHLVNANEVKAQYNWNQFVENPGDRGLMTKAVLEKLTIWKKPSGEPVYWIKCRKLRFGCEKQVSKFVDYIFDESKKENINAWFFVGLVWHESKFDPFAISKQNAIGLTQLLRRGRASAGIKFVRNGRFRRECRKKLGSCQKPVIKRGMVWLKKEIRRCKSVKSGLMAYNSGKCKGPRKYAAAVIRAMNDIKNKAARIRNEDYETNVAYTTEDSYSSNLMCL